MTIPVPSLDDRARRRFARHLLLAEVGERGQARLCAHEAAITGNGRAAEVATLYLERAGVRVDPDAQNALGTADGEQIAALAPRPELREAAAFLAGAFAAVEEIKRALGVGRAGELPRALKRE